MKDRYGRNIEYVRISLTDRCNLHCRYCMPKDASLETSAHFCVQQDAGDLTTAELLRAVSGMRDLGIRHIKLTGGEPLLRCDCAGIACMLKSMQGIETVTLTTNGVLLKRDIEALSEAGLDAVNISLDTLDAHQYKEMCGHDRLKEVLEGIHAALAQPGLKVKLNAVLMRETIDQIPKLAAMARDYPLSLRFIEMMPIGYGKGQELQSEMQVRSVLEEHFGPMLPNDKPHGNGPSHYFKLDGFQGDIGFISALSHKFCTSCNRVRLTADGFLKGCLQYKDGVSLRDLMRNGCTQEQLMHAIETCIYDKPAGHHFAQERPEDVTGEDEGRTMSQIGG